ncbi:CheY chemotaxis protein or a CheY-like REC (receiver) domain [Kaistia soli DSM 19436]|uniref:CheY chemotaxis protein or a CheY-like REC (Receiver) domain n=1 Tax=Kaistia soli DSM 19436 TaxID=1122133 RepID=A0A1M4X944_9HYPH|nr:response regulator [Kaistia soli]SHE90024.1 CheY chemotaxis protein or a CheY-like REC (receiver) domain [Kaistia soli DSM 19436]
MISSSTGIILVVEDEPILRMVMSDQLGDLGFTTIEAEDASAALPVLAGDLPIALMITDVELPGMDGRALAERALALRPSLGILFSTGDVAGIRLWPGFDPATMQAIGKPFEVKDLVAAMTALIKQPLEAAGEGQ